MEKLQDFTYQLKSRFANPLLFSFGCSWLIYNWQIVVALLWYDKSQFETSETSSIFQFISTQLDVEGSFCYPLLFALGYTVLMPLLKNLIRALYSWFNKWGEKWNLKISEGGKIPVEKYIKLRQEYTNRTKEIENVITSETEMVGKFEEIATENRQLQTEKNQLDVKVTEAKLFKEKLHDVKMLNGHWTNTYIDSLNVNLRGTEEVHILDGNYYVVSANKQEELFFRITNFYFDSDRKSVFFVKERIGELNLEQKPHRHSFNINELKFNDALILTGIENGTVNITYKKKEPPQEKKKVIPEIY